MSDTAQRILDVAQELIQRRGFNAFSYDDISKRVGIRKPSIHYHFPTKFDLGRAVIERYDHSLKSLMDDAETNPDLSSFDTLSLYFDPYLKLADTEDLVCLCGALAGEFSTLPVEMQAEVTRFFEGHQNWLEKLLKRGRKSGQFKFDGPPKRVARFIFNALQGALLIKRSRGDKSQLLDVIKEIEALVRPKS